jgi:hypothetical protein
MILGASDRTARSDFGAKLALIKHYDRAAMSSLDRPHVHPNDSDKQQPNANS